MKAAILNETGEVVNIISADKAFCDEHYPGLYILLDADQNVDGLRWDGKEFVPLSD